MSPGVWLCLVSGEPQWENGGKEENEVEVFISPAPSLWCQGHYELSACLDQTCPGTLCLSRSHELLPPPGPSDLAEVRLLTEGRPVVLTVTFGSLMPAFSKWFPF